MPIYLEISRLHRCVTIVARGDLSPEEIAGACRQLADEGVSHFAKLVDTSSSTSVVGQAEMEQIVQSLRGRSPEAARGPVAFLVDRNEPSFAGLYAETQDKRRGPAVHQPPPGARLADADPARGLAKRAATGRQRRGRRARGERAMVRPAARRDDVPPRRPASRRAGQPQPAVLRRGVGQIPSPASARASTHL